MIITLYSTGCPKCQILEKRLKKNNIDFVISNDVDVLIEKGFQSAPIMAVGKLFYDYSSAMNLLKKYENMNWGKMFVGGND